MNKFYSKLDKLINHYEDLRGNLSQITNFDGQEYIKLTKEYADLGNIIEPIKQLRSKQKELNELEELLRLPQDDSDLKTIVEEECTLLRSILPQLENEVKILLLPKDIDDERNAILEVRAGTGGDEAGLFAAQLLRMYQRYATNEGWVFDILSSSESGIGSIKEASASITGKGVFAKLKFESGVHRVQRVPVTESGGRVHTSTATVAVLPEVEEVDVEIDSKDLRIDVCRASGAGGQHVNTTDSAVRITHLPTGIVVSQQDERSQHKNKAKAMKILLAKLYESQKNAIHAERAANRKDQVGTGERSERIRTYNFPQGRVSDHRINLTLYKLALILEGEALEEMIDALITDDQARRLASSEED
jgi:peptide chain release factor 1